MQFEQLVLNDGLRERGIVDVAVDEAVRDWVGHPFQTISPMGPDLCAQVVAKAKSSTRQFRYGRAVVESVQRHVTQHILNTVPFFDDQSPWWQWYAVACRDVSVQTTSSGGRSATTYMST